MATRHVHDDAPDTEQDFLRLANTPEGRERDTLVEQLVEAWLPMARRLAGRYRNKGENPDDLNQVAALGLVKAVERYEPGRGAFEAYAVPTITGELRRHFRDYTWDVRVPRRVQDLRNKVRVARRDLLDEPDHRHEPDLEEIAARAGLTLDEVRRGMEALESYSSLSLDAELGSSQDAGDGISLADTLGQEEPEYDLVADREAAKEGLRTLPERERSILYMRFFEDMTQSRIAQEMGVSQMHISRLISRSCAQVREYAAPDITESQQAA
ncbi:SigB/SigF/SigG family RNA polymerase sigma factor [Streptomyces sp. NBC_00356]|uniref:SigB/SigF/SigG family RNA polymerase sigma factor n=1 Tax=Streptomyces sp. NBC_00356 TaxID=2975724 RepID=UPI002E2774A9